MEKLNSYFSLKKIRSSIAAFARPDTMWRFLLSISLIIALALVVAGLISYEWATHPTIPATPQKKSVTVSREELRATIDIYKAKQKRFEDLQTQQPTPPMLGGSAPLDEATNIE